MTEKEWMERNDFRYECRSCYDCVHHILNKDFTYSCSLANHSIGKKVIIATTQDGAENRSCKNFRGD